MSSGHPFGMNLAIQRHGPNLLEKERIKFSTSVAQTYSPSRPGTGITIPMFHGFRPEKMRCAFSASLLHLQHDAGAAQR